MKKLILIIFISTLLFLLGCQQQVSCNDECSADSCKGFTYYSCLQQADGCKDKIEEGMIKGQCGVECIEDSDCSENMQCAENYKCEKKVEKKAEAPIKEEVKEAPSQVEFKRNDICGDNIIGDSKKCDTCPEDVKCDRDSSCINSECVEYKRIWVEERKAYCQYTDSLKGKNDNLLRSAVRFVSSCKDEGRGSEKLGDGKSGFYEDQWGCTNKDKTALSMPQWAAIEFDKPYLINRLRVVNNGHDNHEWNTRTLTFDISTDSTNGKDGHWINVIGSQRVSITEGGKRTSVATPTDLPNQYDSWLDEQFMPVTAKWIRINVHNLWNAPYDKFNLAEFYVFPALLECRDDL